MVKMLTWIKLRYKRNSKPPSGTFGFGDADTPSLNVNSSQRKQEKKFDLVFC